MVQRGRDFRRCLGHGGSDWSCPTIADATCLLPEDSVTYNGWDPDIWSFGSVNELPKLEGIGLSDVGLQGQLRIRVYLGGATRRGF